MNDEPELAHAASYLNAQRSPTTLGRGLIGNFGSLLTTQPEPVFTLQLSARDALALHLILGHLPGTVVSKAYADGAARYAEGGGSYRPSPGVAEQLLGQGISDPPQLVTEPLWRQLGTWLRGLRYEAVPQPEPPKRLIHVGLAQDRR